MTRPPASAFQARPAWVSTKLEADGKASFCACGRERYSTACAADAIEARAAAGAVHRIQSDIGSPFASHCRLSLRAKRSNLASLVHARVAEIASSRFALLAMTRELEEEAHPPRIASDF